MIELKYFPIVIYNIFFIFVPALRDSSGRGDGNREQKTTVPKQCAALAEKMF
jgi:hypothetical protein